MIDSGNMTLSTQMADQGIITTNSYSLAMDRKGTTAISYSSLSCSNNMAHKNTLAGFADCNGTLIFGGIDTKKFAGELIRLKTFNIGYGKRRKVNLGGCPDLFERRQSDRQGRATHPRGATIHGPFSRQ